MLLLILQLMACMACVTGPVVVVVVVEIAVVAVWLDVDVWVTVWVTAPVIGKYPVQDWTMGDAGLVLLQLYTAVRETGAFVALNGLGSLVAPSDHPLKLQLPLFSARRKYVWPTVISSATGVTPSATTMLPTGPPSTV
jgi:hypothetical protein